MDRGFMKFTKEILKAVSLISLIITVMCLWAVDVSAAQIASGGTLSNFLFKNMNPMDIYHIAWSVLIVIAALNSYVINYLIDEVDLYKERLEI
jgi:hypothetical protein